MCADKPRKILTRPGRGADAKKPAKRDDAERAPRVYTDAEIRDLITGDYITVPRELWEYIPTGSHIRYAKRGAEPLGERFKSGGTVRNHHEKDGVKMIMLENKAAGGAVWPVVLDATEAIWKRHAPEVLIEMHLIHNSLAQKKRQIEELTARLDALEGRQRLQRRDSARV